MAKEQRHQQCRSAVRKLMSGSGGVQAVERWLEQRVESGGSRDEMLDELVCWLLAVQDGYRQGAPSDQLPAARVMERLRRVARDRNIAPEHLYAAILEGMITDGEPVECVRPATRAPAKARILDAALEVFSEKGFHPATVDEIAERAEVGKGTLYRYFANKETLFNELVRLRIEELENQAAAVLNGEDDVLTMISKYLRVYFEFFDRNQQLYRLIVQEGLDAGGQVQDIYFRKIIRRTPLLKRKIYGASQQGVLKDVDFQTVFYGVMGFVHGVILKWLARDCSYSLTDELPGVLEVLYYGFVNRPGQCAGNLDHQGGRNG